MKLENLIGKEVKIYPEDTYYKNGIIEEISNNGVLFKITSSNKKSNYIKGSYRFIAFSARLSFEVIN